MLKFRKSWVRNSNEYQVSVLSLCAVVNLRRQFSIALIALLALSLPVTAMAQESNENEQSIQPQDVPQNLRVPSDQVLVLRTLGYGVQVYDCKPSTTAPKTFVWTFRQPQANLFSGDWSKQAGIHGRGPFWASYDGSRTTGSVKASVPSPDPLKDIPLLLLSAKSDGGDGIFSRVNFIQRLDTRGGVAPTGTCNPNRNPSIGVPYSAFYYFYGNSP